MRWILQLLCAMLVVCTQAILMLGFEVYELDVLTLLPYYLQKDYFNTFFVFVFFFLFIQTINGLLSTSIEVKLPTSLQVKLKFLPSARSIRLSDLFWLAILSYLWWQTGGVLIQGDWIKRQSWASVLPWILTLSFLIGWSILIIIKNRFQKLSPLLILLFCFGLSWINTHVWVDLYLHFAFVVSSTSIVAMQYVLTVPHIQKLSFFKEAHPFDGKWYTKILQIILIALMVYLSHLFLINEKPYRYIERAKIIHRVLYPFQDLKPKLSLLELLVNNKRFDDLQNQAITANFDASQQTANQTANQRVYQNVVWIVVDTLRSDAILNDYWQEDLSKQKLKSFNPILQTWMDHSVVFDTAYTSASRTMWAMPSMFNSIYPYEYKTKNHQGVAAFFKDHQFMTHAVVPQYFSLPMDDNVQDLLVGFDQVSLYDEEKQHLLISQLNDQIQQINQNQSKLPANVDQKHFFWLHFYMMHHPGYLNAKSLSASKDGNGKERYRKSLMELDQQLFEVLRSLSALPNYENTMIVFTSDHGELLGEHGKFGHGAGISAMETNVPMFFDLNPKNALQALMKAFPNQKYNQGKTKFEPVLPEPTWTMSIEGAKGASEGQSQANLRLQKGFHIKKPAGTVDILPTIADFAHLKENPLYPFRGRSLKKELLDPNYKADPKNNPYLMQNGNASVVALVDETLKIVFNQSQQRFYMFDVSTDPALNKDIFNLKEPRSQKMITKFLEKQPLILQNELNQTDKIAIKSQNLLTKKISQLFTRLKSSQTLQQSQSSEVTTQEFEFWIALLKLYKKHAILLDPVQKQLLDFTVDQMAFFLREIPVKALDERKGLANVVKYETLLSQYYAQLQKNQQEQSFFKALIQKQAKLYLIKEIKTQFANDVSQKKISPLSETILDYLSLNDVPAHLLFEDLKSLYLISFEDSTKQIEMQAIRTKIFKLFSQMYYIAKAATNLQDQVSLFLLEESKIGHLLPNMQQDLYLTLKNAKSTQNTAFFIDALKGNDLNLLKIALQSLIEVEKENAIEHILPLERNFLMIYDLSVEIRKLIEDRSRLTYALQLKANVYERENEDFKQAVASRKKHLEQAINWLRKIHKTHYNPINRWEAKKGIDAYEAVGKPVVKKK